MPHPTEPVAVLHPEHGLHVALDPAVNYADDDILVRTYPWAFTAKEDAGKVVESVKIEQATAAPGEKRSVRVKK